MSQQQGQEGSGRRARRNPAKPRLEADRALFRAKEDAEEPALTRRLELLHFVGPEGSHRHQQLNKLTLEFIVKALQWKSNAETNLEFIV